MYAGRVRSFSGDSLLPEAHLTSFASTYLSSLRRPLAPGLQELHIWELEEHEWTTLLSVCSTTLKFVHLSGDDKDEGGRMIGGFLHSLECDGSHSLEGLSIHGAHHNHVDLITKFHMLQDVELSFNGETTGALLIEGFSKLSALNHLSKLRIEWNTTHEDHLLVYPSLPPPSVSFRSLHSIDIVVPAYMALLLFQCSRVNTLKRIILHCYSPPQHQTTSLKRIIDKFGLAAPSLEEVILGFNIDQETFDAVLDLTLRFRLRTLKTTWAGFEIDDAYIHKACLSGCFSHLEVLSLVTYSAGYCPTFQVLRSLAIHCRHLKDLDLSFTIEEEHLPLLIKEMENEHSLSHCLKSLIIRPRIDSENTKFLANGESIPIVSQYLDSLFPSLARCDTVGPIQYLTFGKGIRLTLKALQHRSAMDSRRLVGSQVKNFRLEEL